MRLPRYFLNIRRRAVLIRDEEGDDLPDLDAARALALGTLREMVRLPHVYGLPRTWRRNVFVITDEGGTALLEIPYSDVL
ncbi:DUF6894 family protein [Methylobacterium trifolii]|uniref:DUF6894 domain-containing protein n=1 Tax=Methylobacterium trifolii TaxID=1003092 RepID=A0ABQ4U424_9HYPH|nr:hypothetical protein [Methylobacterium trifolii]GJE62155.1 hypothetical protein MPOCJGCO_4285 [Methylobacterium trifolii]